MDWRPHTQLPAHAEVAASTTLVVWDFDHSLAAEHMWSHLRTEQGQRQRESNPAAFYDVIFGGAERLQRLRACLSAIKSSGAHLFILSNGIEAEIEAALRFANLRDAFTAVLGGEAQTQLVPDTPSNAAQRSIKPDVLAQLAVGGVEGAPAGCTHLVFIDDDMDNYPSDEPPDERAAWQLAAPGKSAASDAPVLIAWPVVPAAGLSAEGMSRLESLLGASSSPSSSSSSGGAAGSAAGGASASLPPSPPASPAPLPAAAAAAGEPVVGAKL